MNTCGIDTRLPVGSASELGFELPTSWTVFIWNTDKSNIFEANKPIGYDCDAWHTY